MGLIYSTPTAPRSLNYRHSGVPDWTGKEEHTEHTSPPQTQLATSDVEAGAELGEGRGRETLGEDVGELRGGRYVEDPNIADRDSITDKV